MKTEKLHIQTKVSQLCKPMLDWYNGCFSGNSVYYTANLFNFIHSIVQRSENTFLFSIKWRFSIVNDLVTNNNDGKMYSSIFSFSAKQPWRTCSIICNTELVCWSAMNKVLHGSLTEMELMYNIFNIKYLLFANK